MRKNKSRKIIILLLFIINYTTAICQSKECYTDEYYEIESNNGNDYTDSILSVNARFQSFRTTGVLSDHVVFIPVIFHVVYNGDVSSPGNISDAQIIDALVTLNNAFSNQNSSANGVNCKFQFCLAKVDQFNNPVSNGVTRHSSLTTSFTMPTDEANLKSYVGGSFSPYKYLNIWVTDLKGLIYNSLTGLYEVQQINGFSSFPQALTGNPSHDGIVIDYRRLGSVGAAANQTPICLGKTLPHEVGHWLGLYHTFENFGGADCVNNNCNFDGDLICDTPPVLGTAYSQSPLVNSTSCSTRKDCNFNNIPAENYMEYNFDNCLNFFTPGQKDKMRYICSYYRNYFWLNSLNNPQIFPIECTTPSTSSNGGTSSGCSDRKWPDERLYVNGKTTSYIELCSGTPVMINVEHNSLCTRIPLKSVRVPCIQDPDCSWIQENIWHSCECHRDEYQYFLAISYGCDENFNCPYELASWFAVGYGSSTPTNIDIGAKLGFNFQSNTNYKIKLAVGDDNNNWREGQKNIRFIGNDLYITGNANSNLKATNSISFENANIPNLSSYTASSYIAISPNSGVSGGSEAVFYISPISCSSSVNRLSNTNDSTRKDTSQNYQVIQLPKRNYVTDLTSIKLIVQKPNIKIIPNPSTDGIFNISIDNKNIKKIEVLNSLQTLVAQFQNTNIINLSDNTPGVYYAIITTDDEVYNEKLIFYK